jgi:homoserine kinase type II
MSAVTPLPEQALTQLLERYDLGRLESHWPATYGIENSNYFVRVGDARGSHEVVLTVLERQSTASALLVPLLDTCEEAGLPVAPIIRTRAGHAHDEILGRPTLIAPRLMGRHVLNPTARHCASVGRFLARFHRVSRHLTRGAEPHPRDGQWMIARTAEAKRALPYGTASLLDCALHAALSLLGRSDVGRLPYGVVHGDLFRDNVLFTERGLTGVLDFHHAAGGYLVFDIAVALNDWCTDSSGVIDSERMLALLRAYHRIRPLQAEELWHLGPFALYAGLTFWLSRLKPYPAAEGERPARFKNPDEFRRIVQRHLAHLPYFDPRQLSVA